MIEICEEDFPQLTDSDIIELWDKSGGSTWRFSSLIRDRLKTRAFNPERSKQIDEDLEDVDLPPDGASPKDLHKWRGFREKHKSRISFNDWMAADLKERRMKHLSNLTSKKKIPQTKVERVVEKINRKARER